MVTAVKRSSQISNEFVEGDLISQGALDPLTRICGNALAGMPIKGKPVEPLQSLTTVLNPVSPDLSISNNVLKPSVVDQTSAFLDKLIADFDTQGKSPLDILTQLFKIALVNNHGDTKIHSRQVQETKALANQLSRESKATYNSLKALLFQFAAAGINGAGAIGFGAIGVTSGNWSNATGFVQAANAGASACQAPGTYFDSDMQSVREALQHALKHAGDDRQHDDGQVSQMRQKIDQAFEILREAIRANTAAMQEINR